MFASSSVLVMCMLLILQEGVLAMGSKASLEGLDRYLELYDKRVSELVDKQLDIKEEIRIAEAKKASLMKNLQERTSQVKVTSTFTKEERYGIYSLAHWLIGLCLSCHSMALKKVEKLMVRRKEL